MHVARSLAERDSVLEADLYSQPDIRSVVFGGVAATLVMTAVTYGGPWLGVPNFDIAAMLGAMLTGGTPEKFAAAWWAGFGWHVLNGVLVFPLLYASLFLPARRVSTRGARVARGTLWGVLLWVVAQALVMPMMGGGFFSHQTLHPVLVVFGSLLSHVCYGATLGRIARLRSARFIEITQNRAA